MLIDCIVVGVFQSNCYLVADDETHDGIVIDPGDEPEKILERIARHDLNIKYILLTHAHLDHVMGVRRVKEALNPELLMHQADAFLYENMVDQAAQFGCRVDSPVQIDRYITEGDGITLGDVHVSVLSTPGHSPGGVSFPISGDPSIVFSGDTLFAGSIGRTDLPGGSHDTLLRSIREKLFMLDGSTIVYAGHGSHTTIGYEQQHNPFFIG